MRSLLKIGSLAAIIVILLASFNSYSQEKTAASAGPVLNSDKIAAGGVLNKADSTGPAVTNFTTDAKQAILVDFNSDSVLFEKDADTRMFPSSMTKVVTMYLVFDQIRKAHITMDTEYTVSKRSWKTGGSQMFLKVDDKVKVGDLIQGVTVDSANDGCVTLAEGISGSVEAFVEDMNAMAKYLGMTNTHFANANGLPTEGHYTTARDLSIIAKRMITDFPEYYHYFSQREFKYANISQHNRNKLLDVTDLGVDGMKTGFTDMGGYGIIATGVNNGRRLIAVVNGLNSDKERMRAASEMLRYGYNNFKSIKLFSKFEAIDKVKVWNGEQDYVSIAPDKDIELMVNSTDYNSNNYKTEIAFKEPWIAPIKKDTNIASLIVKNSGGKIIQQVPLYATTDVAEAGIIKQMFQKIRYLLGKR